jgi:hypothetical protein
MKTIQNYFITLILLLAVFHVEGQVKKEKCFISKEDIVGTWQRNEKIVADGLNQNFQFFKNNTFVFNIGDNGDDVRNIIQLKGKYRLDNGSLFFTITSRTIVEGAIEISDTGISLNIFDISRTKTKEISEKNSKELDPCYITFYSNTHIEINHEIYYKVKVK